MKHTYSTPLPRWVPRPLAALGLLLATAGAAQAQSGALVKTTALQADATRPAAQARPMPATVTTYQPVGTTAQARQQTQAQTAAAVATTTVTFTNTQQGWFSLQNGHDAGNANYIVGSYERFSGRGSFRNFFTFSLASLNLTGKQVVGATLSLVNGSTAVPNSTVTYSLYDVSTPTATLGTTYPSGDPVVTSVFNDLGTGKSYGSFVNTAASTGRRVYTLAAPALADIAARAGQTFSLGGMLLEEQATVDTYLFGGTGSISGNDGVGQQILTLELADAAITTGAVSTAVCAGASLNVPFTAAGTFSAGNIFTAQLSNAAGSFAAPVAIGTLTSTSSGTVAATIPAATAGGSGYRVRVVSSNPAVTGTDNGSAITITGLPTLTSLNLTSGPVGTSVTLTGTNLTGATAVRFNNTAASSFVVNSATSITATVPAGAGSGNVTVTTPCGTSGGLAFTVTTTPTVTTATPTNITTTGATLGVAVSSNGGAPGSYSYGFVYVQGTGTPTLSNTIGPPLGGSNVGSSPSTYNTSVVNLTPGTTYTVRGYATNSVGTAYGSALTFTTLAAPTTVVSINRVGSSPTNAGSVSYTVTFAAPVTGLSTSNFALTTTGSVAGASLASVTGTGTTYTVTANTGTGDGTLGLTLANATGLTPSVSNVPFAGQTYTIDKTAPTVTITSPTAPNGGYTTTSPLTFVVTFSEAVMGYDIISIADNVTNAVGGSIDVTNAPTYTVTLFPAAPGAVTLSVPAGIVTDAAGNANVAAVPPTYTIYYNVPTATPVVTSPANNSTTATATPTYQGTAPAGSTVTVFVDGRSIGTTTATTGGAFSLTQPTALTQGSHTVYATALASGQAVSANSNTNTFTVASAPTITMLSPATGPVGTQVTITGTNLSGATAVRFGNTAASSFVINSATSLTAVVAPGTTTGLVTVTTPGGTATSATPFVVRVAPTTVADTYSTPVGVTLTGNVLTNDLGTSPRAILITRPSNGTLALNPDGSFTYRPNPGFSGQDSFTYYACDPNLPLLCGNPATVTISVLRIAPVTVPDTYTTSAGVTLTGNVLTNDLGTNPRAILIIRPTNGTLLLNPDGTFTYQPNPGFVGTDSFLYYACDPALPLLCGNPATVTINVVRVAPVTVADSYTTPQNTTLTGNVLTNDLGNNPQAILIIRPTRGTLLLNPNGTFTYQPNAGFVGTDSFIYYACNQGAPLVCGDPATVTITVRPANTATRTANPNATKPSTTTLAGAAQELTLTGSPNPFSQELRVQFALPTAQAYTLAVYDAQGRLVQQLARGQAEAGQAQELVVPTQTYATGLYLLRLTTPSGTQLLKLIKQ